MFSFFFSFFISTFTLLREFYPTYVVCGIPCNKDGRWRPRSLLEWSIGARHVHPSRGLPAFHACVLSIRPRHDFGQLDWGWNKTLMSGLVWSGLINGWFILTLCRMACGENCLDVTARRAPGGNAPGLGPDQKATAPHALLHRYLSVPSTYPGT